MFAYSQPEWNTAVGSRAWTAINDQNANCWGLGAVAVEPPSQGSLACGPLPPSATPSPTVTPTRSATPSPSKSPASFDCSGEYPHKHQTQSECCRCADGPEAWGGFDCFYYGEHYDAECVPVAVTSASPSPTVTPTRSASPSPSRPPADFSCSGSYPHKHSTQTKCC
jgi:hypothetical protein